MKKIKSSLELAMEKLGDMQENKEDLEKFDEEKYLKAAAHLGNSFLNGKTDKEQVAETLHTYPKGIQEKARRAFMTRLTASIDLTNIQEVLEAVSFIGDNDKIRKICEQTAAVFQEFTGRLLENKTMLEKNSRSSMTEELAKQGFFGSALAGLNIGDSRQWQEKSAAFAAEYMEIVKKFKDEIEGDADGYHAGN